MPMRIIKSSSRKRPKLSFVLLDWSVRESFHILHYLRLQDCDRDDFEVIIIEYYEREYEGIRKYEDQVDTWVALQMPPSLYYNKHLMYNVGIVLARGDIISICDSDAMVQPGHVQRIVRNFAEHPGSIFHIDQFRNNRRDLYPFCFPAFDEVTGAGCINNVNGRTAGIVDQIDPIHSRNYGACMCARRQDLIAIGAADEHIDFVGHICGPYDMTFRLLNHGLQEIWADDEFTCHTWHPGQAGVDNYLGPHDGRHMSTTSLFALVSRRVLPLVENAAVRMLRQGRPLPAEPDSLLIDQGRAAQWRHSELDGGQRPAPRDGEPYLAGSYRGARVVSAPAGYMGQWIGRPPLRDLLHGKTFTSLDALHAAVDASLGLRQRFWLFSYHALSRALHIARLLVRICRRPDLLTGNITQLRNVAGRVSRDQKITFSGVQDVLIYLGAAPLRADPPAQVVVLDQIDELLLRLFADLRVLPRVNTVRVADLADAGKALDAARSSAAHLLIQASIFMRFYSVFRQAGSADLTVI